MESYSSTGQPGAPQTQAQYEEYLGGLLAHGAKVVNVYGWNIPWIARSPYRIKNSGVVSAVKKWLSGGSLPATWSGEPIPDIQAKMVRLQKAAQEAVRRGRDPRRVMKTVKGFEHEFEPLMKSGKIPQAEAVLDRTLIELDEGKQGAL